MSELAKNIAGWIWDQAGLYKDDESWCSFMFDDAVKRIDKLIEDNKTVEMDGSNR